MEIIAWAFMAVSLYVWSRSIWASIAALAFAAGVWILATRCVNAIIEEFQRAKEIQTAQLLELIRRSQHSEKLQSGILARLDSMAAMAEFVGEQSHPNFANVVKNFKDAQEEDRRKQAQRESEERHFKERLDAAVLDARVEREKKANATREAFRQSHEAKQTE